jgi:hypothetical protein
MYTVQSVFDIRLIEPSICAKGAQTVDTAVSRVETQAGRLSRSRRRQYVINPGFQWRVVLTVSLLVFLCSSIISSTLYGVLHAQARSRVMDPTGYTAEVPLVVIGFGLAFSLVAAVAVGLWCIVMTHRICGPLYVMSGWLEDLAANRTARMRPLRKNDEFQEFYQTLRRAVESVATRQSRALEAATTALSCAESVRTAAEPERSASANSLVQQLQAVRDILRQAN